MRLNKTSIANLKVCDSVQIIGVYHEHLDCSGYMIRCYRGDCFSYLHSGNGDIMDYSSTKEARRAVRRIRPDIEPTEI